MSQANRPSKRTLDMIAHQKAIWEDFKAAVALLAPVVGEIEEEEIRLNYLEAEHERAKLRGETPDPSEVARVQIDKTAFQLRCEKLKELMKEMERQCEAITQIADDGLSQELRRKFNAQFNTKKDL